MKPIDILLQKWRIKKAARFIPSHAKIIDVGAHTGELFQSLGGKMREGFGVEPLLDTDELRGPNYAIKKGCFPERKPDANGWDCITMLAVLEHIPKEEQPDLTRACHALLREGGRVIITVPSPLVDRILEILGTLRLIDGMSLHEHWGFSPGDTAHVFAPPGFALLHHKRFQLGLNHIFVFEKRSLSGEPRPRSL
jgi:SAM-dependent methyltransferase